MYKHIRDSVKKKQQYIVIKVVYVYFLIQTAYKYNSLRL